LAAESGGAAFALYLVTDVNFRIWALVVGASLLAVLLNARFAVVENAPSLLGLVTLSFVVASFTLGTPWKTAALDAATPGVGGSGTPLEYFFIATAIIGSVSSPYLPLFYSACAGDD